MDVAHQLQQIGILLAEDGFITVLEKMPAAPVATVKAYRIPGKQPLHYSRDRNISGPQQQVEMVRHEGPSVTGGPRLSENLTEPAEKILPVRVISVNTPALNPTADNMLQRSGGINAGSARHAGILPKPIQKIKQLDKDNIRKVDIEKIREVTLEFYKKNNKNGLLYSFFIS